MQICASYKIRRDLVEAAKVPGILGRARLLTNREASTQACTMLDAQCALNLHPLLAPCLALAMTCLIMTYLE